MTFRNSFSIEKKHTALKLKKMFVEEFESGICYRFFVDTSFVELLDTELSPLLTSMEFPTFGEDSGKMGRLGEGEKT